MVKKFTLLIFVFSFSILQAQTISTHSWKNGLKELAVVPDSMTYNEFLTLQREVNWQRIMASAFIPGYLHFYADHQKEGWYIVAARSIGAGLMLYGILDELHYANTLDFISAITKKDELEDRSERNLILFITGTVINVLGFSIDWAHADWVISKERNEVLYKYGIKMRGKLSPKVSLIEGTPYYGFNLRINF